MSGCCKGITETPLIVCSSTNEKIDRSNFIEGVRYSYCPPACSLADLKRLQTKLLGSYLYELAASQ